MSNTKGARLGAVCKHVATTGWRRSNIPTCSKGSCCCGGGAGTASSTRARGGCGPRLAAAAPPRCRLPPVKAGPPTLPPPAKALAAPPPECSATGLPADWADPRRAPRPPLLRLGRQPLDRDCPLSGFWRGEEPSACSCSSQRVNGEGTSSGLFSNIEGCSAIMQHVNHSV